MTNKLTSNNIFLLGLIAVLVVCAYSFVLHNEFKTMDDTHSIVANRDIRSFANIPRVFTSSFFGADSYYRPLVTLSFMAEYHYFGLNAVGYYLDNILLHILNAFAVFFLVRAVSREDLPAFFASLLFAIHPVQWEAVSNIPGRAILLCALFYLLTANLFVRSVFRDAPGPMPGRKRFYVASLFSYLTALLCKESALILPVILLVYQALVIRPRIMKGEKGVSWVLPVIPFFALAGAYSVYRRLIGVTHFYFWEGWRQALLGFSTFLRGLVTYLRLIILPVDLQFDRATPLFLRFDDPALIATLLFFAAGAVALICLRKKFSASGVFFGFWFFLGLGPVSQILFTIGVQPGYISSAEHFLYIPSVGLFSVLALAGCALARANSRRAFVSSGVFKTGVAGLFIYFFALTVTNNIYSGSEIAMLRRTVELNPRNVRVRYNLAVAYVHKRMFAEAEQEFREVLKISPGMIKAQIALGKSLVDQGKYWDGVRAYEAVPDAREHSAVLANNLKVTLEFMSRRFASRLEQDPDNPDLLYTLGVVDSKLGRLDKAKELYIRALNLRPGLAEAWFNLGSLQLATGEPEAAGHSLRQFLALSGSDPELTKVARSALRKIQQDLKDIPRQGGYNK